MALYQNDYRDKIVQSTSEEYKRTNVKLVKDDGRAPSGKYMVDPKLPRKFRYEFGGQMGWVVIPKGRIVALVPDRERKSFDDGTYYNMLTIANGGVDVVERDDSPEAKDGNTYIRKANKPVGVSALNVYQDLDDQFAGNIPVFITRDNINIPYFATKEDAEQTEWASAYGDFKPGDKVKSDENGRFVKWEEYKERMDVFSGDGTTTTFYVKTAIHPDATKDDIVATVNGSAVEVASIKHATGEVVLAAAPATGTDNVEITYKSVMGDDIEQKVGMVIRVDKNLIPAGWLKWAMPEGFDNPVSPDLGYRASDLEENNGYPYDPGYIDGYDGERYRATGIPGLTDGMNYVKEYTGEVIGTLQPGTKAGDKLSFRVLSEYTPIVEGSVKLYFENTTNGIVEKTNVAIDFIDHESGLIIVEVDADITETTTVKVDFKATHQMPGMPANLDYKNVLGSLDILLQL